MSHVLLFNPRLRKYEYKFCAVREILGFLEIVEERMKDTLTAFTADGDFLAVLTTVKTVMVSLFFGSYYCVFFFSAILVVEEILLMFQVWNTNNGSLLAEWKPEDREFGSNFSCLACSFVGKKVVLLLDFVAQVGQ